MGFEQPRDLKAEYLSETKRELLGYKDNRPLMESGDAPEGTVGIKAGQYLHNVSKQGVTYEQIDSTPAEIEELFGTEMREAFDRNEAVHPAL